MADHGVRHNYYRTIVYDFQNSTCSYSSAGAGMWRMVFNTEKNMDFGRFSLFCGVVGTLPGWNLMHVLVCLFGPGGTVLGLGQDY